jgi:hypothetical protein
MIMSNMLPCTIEQRNSGVDSYGQPLTTFTTVKTVDVSITLTNQFNTPTDIRYKDATHLGLTFDKTLTDNMRVVSGGTSYIILLVNNQTRMTQLVLKEQ